MVGLADEKEHVLVCTLTAMSESRDLLGRTSELAAQFVDSLGERPVLPDIDVDALRAALDRPLQEAPLDAREVIEELAADADPGLAGMPSGRASRLPAGTRYASWWPAEPYVSVRSAGR